MVIINDRKFYEEPGSCGTCPFLFVLGKETPSFLPSSGNSGGVHHCAQWDEWHHTWTNCPRRCKKLFKAAFQNPDGSVLVIVPKDV